jgi:O-antigen/teichoic acid export membrane protein
MNADGRDTTRNAAFVLLQRVVQLVAGILFLGLVPSVMGPENYGRYALVSSLAIWFALFSGLGFTELMSRYVPEFLHRGEGERLREFLGALLGIRLVSGAIAAGLYLILTLAWLRDLDPVVLGIGAASVSVQAVANFFFAVLLARNQAARWAMADTARRWLLLMLVWPGFSLGGLRGACLALLVTELLVLWYGVRRFAPRLSAAELRPNLGVLAPFLRFGLTLFSAQLLFAAFHASGQPLVRVLSGNYAEVGYFGLAQSIFLVGALALPQFTNAFAPMLGTLLAQGKAQALGEWAQRLLKWLAVAGVLGVVGALFLAEGFVAVLLGTAYRPVGANLVPLSLALLTLTISSVMGLLALVHDRTGTTLAASGLRLIALWIFSGFLVGPWGSLGGCQAVFGACVLHAGYFAWRMRGVVGSSLKSWGAAVGLAGPLLPLLWLRSSAELNLALFASFVAGYGGLLLLFRLVTPGELSQILSAVGRPSKARTG